MQVTSTFWVVTQSLPTAERATIPHTKEERQGFHMNPITEIFLGKIALKSRDWHPKSLLPSYTFWGVRLLKRFCKMFTEGVPFLACEVWQLLHGPHHCPLACGAFMKHSSKPFEQPDVPDCMFYRVSHPIVCEISSCFVWGVPLPCLGSS